MYVFMKFVEFDVYSIVWKNLKIPDSLDFLGFYIIFTFVIHAFLRLSYMYFYGYKMCIFTKEIGHWFYKMTTKM